MWARLQLIMAQECLRYVKTAQDMPLRQRGMLVVNDAIQCAELTIKAEIPQLSLQLISPNTR